VLLQQIVNGLTLGSAYAVIAIGYTLVFGVLNIVNMAHGGIFMMGAYIGLLLVTDFGLGLFPALLGAMAGGAVLGYGLEIFALRPLRKHKAGHLAPLISTIGVSIFLESAALLVFGPQTRSFPANGGGQLMDLGLFKISGIQIISLGTSVLLMILLTLLLNRTRLGKAVRATSENAETASLLGIHTGQVITFTVMLASALGAAAGVLIGLSFNAIEPTMGTTMGFKGLAVLIMGGLGNIEGAMAGGFILGIAEVLSVAYGASSYRDAVAFGLIILILFIRPEGLFAKAGKGGRP
jgi:branched-chain amino acid transport system permease protein